MSCIKKIGDFKEEKRSYNTWILLNNVFGFETPLKKKNKEKNSDIRHVDAKRWSGV